MSAINVSPRTFLDVVTHGRADDAWCTFVPDIQQAKGREGRWGWFGGRFLAYEGGQHSTALPLIEQNSYYTLGRLRRAGEGETDRRMLDRWCAGTVVVLDDVGEKTVNTYKVRADLGEPTFIIQTSKFSQQWGYVLEKPVTDLLQMSRLQKALTLRFYPSGKDPGHERAIQYVRLPFGVNNKAARVAENGGTPFPVRLVEWRPALRYDVLDVMTALGSAWSDACNAIASISAQGVSGAVYTDKEMDGYYRTDPVFRAFKEAGMVDESRVNNGYVGVTCPWAAGHSINDDSAGYNPRERNFKCFHSHPEGTPADLDAFFHTYLPQLANGQEYKALRHKLVADQFAAHPLPDDEIDAAALPSTGPKTLEPLAGLAMSVMPARRSICSHLARGEVTYRIGMPAVGKSALALGYALAIATERPDLVGEKWFKRTGAVVILSNEDTRTQYAKRMRAWLDWHKLGRTDLVHPVYTPNVNGVYVVSSDENDVVSLHPDMAWLSDELRVLRAAGIDVALALVDTQAACFHRVPENDNGAMGQAMSLLAKWAEDNNVALEIIHHVPKPKGFEHGGDEIDLMSARGASAAGAAVRNAVGMRPLAKKLNDELPPLERGRWTKELGVKSNHGPKMEAKHWYREIKDVWTDTGDVDDEGNMVGEQEGQPVYVYSATGPAPAFDATDQNSILAALAALDEAAALDRKVKAGVHGGTSCAVDVVRAAMGRSVDDAKDALKAAHESGYVEQVEFRNDQTRRNVKVWALTETGKAFMVECREKVLTETEEGSCAS